MASGPLLFRPLAAHIRVRRSEWCWRRARPALHIVAAIHPCWGLSLSVFDARPAAPPPLPAMSVLVHEAVDALLRNAQWLAARLAVPVLLLGLCDALLLTADTANHDMLWVGTLLTHLLEQLLAVACATFVLRAFILGEWNGSPLQMLRCRAFWATFLAVMGWLFAAGLASAVVGPVLILLLGGGGGTAVSLALAVVMILAFVAMGEFSLWFVSLAVDHRHIGARQALDAAASIRTRLQPGMALLTMGLLVARLPVQTLGVAGEDSLPVVLLAGVADRALKLIWAVAMASFAGRLYVALLPQQAPPKSPLRGPPPLPYTG